MQEKILFKDKNNKNSITNIHILDKLKELGANRCDILYVHTALTFGLSVLKKSELLEELFIIFKSLSIPTLIFPTFTFSFPNGEDFDVQNTKTTMGVFNEYFRKQDGCIRSTDPLMSNVLLGEHREFLTEIGKNSCGKDSTFDLLHKTELNVKFLFFGVHVGDCFTFMHYIENELDAPYRYSRPFTGKIINNGKIYTDTYNLFVRYNNVLPNAGSYIYENIMIERNISKQVKLGDNQITIVPEQAAFTLYQDIFQSYPCFFISEPFKESKKNTDFNLTSKMIAL
ncbi:MAG: AAC(3) family N-acetyltransferase [Bacteroidales bacterium]|jgi:aminoglycoside 3-N-acetyltransferase|nr:AAC(3) family N-acetyltransferase [Bacteroidales bacterium]